ncbi:hypothetical protein F5Y08DRAFT_339948 [Xylaria arbuscula]|nr:hypothetical protein F5Y08DRAFT_339948 [Xylaria arbuscula]
MQRTPPPKLPSRPSLTVNVYTTLPDATKADLPPKPPTTPTTPTPTQLRNPRGILTPSPSPESRSKKSRRGQKRAYAYSTDAIVVPLQTISTLAPERAGQTPLNNHKYDGAGDYRPTEHPAKKMCPQSFNAVSVSQANGNANEAVAGKTTQREVRYVSKLDETQLELQIIHNKLLGGATTLTAQDQYFLRRQINNKHTKISPLMVHLLIDQVTNKTHELSYAIMDWAHKRHETQLLENILVDRLYNFDVEASFEQGLMSIREVSNLMDCQIVLECVRMGRVPKAKTTRIDLSTDSDMNEGDTGSEDMDLSDNSD